MFLATLLACGAHTVPDATPEVGVQRFDVDPPGSVGFSPAGGSTHTVVLLHGSEGGSAPYMPALAQELAGHGLRSIAFCWFDCAGLPSAIEAVSLDRTEAFLQDAADGDVLVLFGVSRGAEHAVLLASLLADDDLVHGVAAHAATDTIVAGFDPATRRPPQVDGGFGAAWTWRGESLYGERALPYGSGPRIALEAYPGPVYLSHGEKDRLWPAERSQRLAQPRLDAGLPTQLTIWPREGHVLRRPQNQAAFVEELVAFIRGIPSG